MHLGRSYPFLDEFWLVETQFWPNFVPRKFTCLNGTLGQGTLWDSWNSALSVSGIGVEDGPNAGDGRWIFVAQDGTSGWLTIRKFQNLPVKIYVANFSSTDVVGNQADAQCIMDLTTQTTWMQNWTVLTPNPPYSIPGNIFMPIVPARWFQI